MSIQYENPWFKVVRDGRFHYVVENKADNGAAVLALLDDKEFLLLRVKRMAHAGIQREIPRGYGEPGETSLACARRELAEETGYLIDESRLRLLGRFKPNSAILASTIDLYLAQVNSSDLTEQRDDEAEAVERISVADMRQLLRDGAIQDGFTLAALAHYFNSFSASPAEYR
ncbi:NUDIX hydrolase [Pseudomonas sp. MYb185]|uniref:NUDIX hydrolase n=1 Tax=Pseudomonas sp. MYb185 TaxID=1848729 RepID=UPI000CFE0AFF|nr:NUDIX hydrolase [Pseudomonas sp. MYb185]PRB84457.1 NUDIX domain-containing protein [Pseudomonas sp. MYb185]